MIKIISHNISGAGYRKGEEGEKRVVKPFVIENALSFNPDIIFFLEYAFPFNHKEVVKRLNNAGYDVRTTDIPTQKFQNGILVAVKSNLNIQEKVMKIYNEETKNLEQPDVLALKLDDGNKEYMIVGIRVRVGVQIPYSDRLKLKSDQIRVISSFLEKSDDRTIVIGDTNYMSHVLKRESIVTGCKYVNKIKIKTRVDVNWTNCNFEVPKGDSYQFKKDEDKEPIRVDCDLAITKNINIDEVSVESYNWDFEDKDEIYKGKNRFEYASITEGYYPDHPAVILTVE